MSFTFYPNLVQYAGFNAAAEPSIAGQVATMSGGETSATSPLYDLLDNTRNNTLSLDTNGETDAATIQVEPSSSITCTFAIIDNHNLKTADARYKIAYNGGANTATATVAYSGALGTELTSDSVSSNYATVAVDGVSLIPFSSASSASWQLIIDDVATFDADVTLGELIFGASFSPTYSPDINPDFGYDMPGSSFNETEGGHRYGYSTHSSKRQSWHFSWKYMTSANKTSLENIFLYQRGIKYPFYFDIGTAATPILYRVRFARPLSFKGLTAGTWQADVYLEEEI